jgi:hypothetical protein
LNGWDVLGAQNDSNLPVCQSAETKFKRLIAEQTLNCHNSRVADDKI